MSEAFFKEWFGPIGRELGKPERFFTRDYRALIRLSEESRREGSPCFCSVQPFIERNKPYVIERLFFDLDCKEDPKKAWGEALLLAEATINFYKALPLIVFSGNKGYHLYVWLRQPYQIGSLEEAHEIYREMQLMILKGFDLKTCDPQPLGDIKRLSRCPYTVNEKSGNLCQPVSLTHKFLEDVELGLYRKYGLPESFVNVATARVGKKRNETVEKKDVFFIGDKRIRPCIQAAVQRSLEGEGGHKMRLAVACEFLNKGWSIDQVIDLFSNQSDFDLGKSRYYIENALRKGYKPFKCETIQQLGYCLGAECGFKKRGK